MERLQRKRHVWMPFSTLLLVLTCLFGCTPRPDGPTVKGSFSRNDKTYKSLELEIADTEQTRHQGLMYRKELGASQGMLFAFPVEEIHSFWMRNTYIPLDMLFIDSKHIVVGILGNVPILNDQPRSVGKPSQFVVELNAGAAEASGILPGDMLVLEDAWPVGK